MLTHALHRGYNALSSVIKGLGKVCTGHPVEGGGGGDTRGVQVCVLTRGLHWNHNAPTADPGSSLLDTPCGTQAGRQVACTQGFVPHSQ